MRTDTLSVDVLRWLYADQPKLFLYTFLYFYKQNAAIATDHLLQQQSWSKDASTPSTARNKAARKSGSIHGEKTTTYVRQLQAGPSDWKYAFELDSPMSTPGCAGTVAPSPRQASWNNPADGTSPTSAPGPTYSPQRPHADGRSTMSPLPARLSGKFGSPVTTSPMEASNTSDAMVARLSILRRPTTLESDPWSPGALTYKALVATYHFLFSVVSVRTAVFDRPFLRGYCTPISSILVVGKSLSVFVSTTGMSTIGTDEPTLVVLGETCAAIHGVVSLATSVAKSQQHYLEQVEAARGLTKRQSGMGLFSPSSPQSKKQGSGSPSALVKNASLTRAPCTRSGGPALRLGHPDEGPRRDVVITKAVVGDAFVGVLCSNGVVLKIQLERTRGQSASGNVRQLFAKDAAVVVAVGGVKTIEAAAKRLFVICHPGEEKRVALMVDSAITNAIAHNESSEESSNSDSSPVSGKQSTATNVPKLSIGALRGGRGIVVAQGGHLKAQARADDVFPLGDAAQCAVGPIDECFVVEAHDQLLYKFNHCETGMHTPRRVLLMRDVPVMKVGAGYGYGVAVDAFGRVWTWGKNKHKQLGHGSNYPEVERKPALITRLLDFFIVDAAVGIQHTLLRSSCGLVFGFGDNRHGQLGFPSDRSNVSRPTRITLPFFCAQISCGPYISVFNLLDDQGTLRVYACGTNDYGQLSTSRKAMAVYSRPSEIVGREMHLLRAEQQRGMEPWENMAALDNPSIGDSFASLRNDSLCSRSITSTDIFLQGSITSMGARSSHAYSTAIATALESIAAEAEQAADRRGANASFGSASGGSDCSKAHSREVGSIEKAPLLDKESRQQRRKDGKVKHGCCVIC